MAKVRISCRGLVITFFFHFRWHDRFQSCPLPFAVFPSTAELRHLLAWRPLASSLLLLVNRAVLALNPFSIFLRLTGSQQLRTTEYSVQLLYYTCLAPSPRGLLHGRAKGPRVAFVASTGCFFDPLLKSLSCAWVLFPAIFWSFVVS